MGRLLQAWSCCVGGVSVCLVCLVCVCVCVEVEVFELKA